MIVYNLNFKNGYGFSTSIYGIPWWKIQLVEVQVEL